MCTQSNKRNKQQWAASQATYRLPCLTGEGLAVRSLKAIPVNNTEAGHGTENFAFPVFYIYRFMNLCIFHLFFPLHVHSPHPHSRYWWTIKSLIGWNRVKVCFIAYELNLKQEERRITSFKSYSRALIILPYWKQNVWLCISCGAFAFDMWSSSLQWELQEAE